jgi:hypothetical protein
MSNATLETASLEHARKELRELETAYEKADREYHEALAFRAESDDDDYLAAREKRERLEELEADYFRLGGLLVTAKVRLEWAERHQ